MYKIFESLLFIVILLASCNPQNKSDEIQEPEECVKVTLKYNIGTPQKTYLKKSKYSLNEYYNKADSIFNTIFKPNIENGDLLGQDIDLIFTNSTTNKSYNIKGDVNSSIILPTGKYNVKGTIGSLDTWNKYVHLSINASSLEITKDSKVITLTGSISNSLIFGDTTFYIDRSTYTNKNSTYKYKGYNYIFTSYSYINTLLDNTWFSFYVGPGKYYFITKNINSLNFNTTLTNGFKQ